jgi:hypothetical protein
VQHPAKPAAPEPIKSKIDNLRMAESPDESLVVGRVWRPSNHTSRLAMCKFDEMRFGNEMRKDRKVQIFRVRVAQRFGRRRYNGDAVRPTSLSGIFRPSNSRKRK